VHDSFLTFAECGEELRDVMQRAYQKRNGGMRIGTENKKNLIIYCDTGASIKKVKKWAMQRSFYARIKWKGFPSENKNKNLENVKRPSAPSWDRMSANWEEWESKWEDTSASENYLKIEEIVGKENKEDVQHLDSAYRSQCQYFFTSDKKDILSNKEQLERLLHLKLFNPHKEFKTVCESIKNYFGQKERKS